MYYLMLLRLRDMIARNQGIIEKAKNMSNRVRKRQKE
jgi:hypothetical protein